VAVWRAEENIAVGEELEKEELKEVIEMLNRMVMVG
jgi:hypothetical protein